MGFPRVADPVDTVLFQGLLGSARGPVTTESLSHKSHQPHTFDSNHILLGVDRASCWLVDMVMKSYGEVPPRRSPLVHRVYPLKIDS